jgi:cell fate regulator YaaT (PSP1 superfamily)
MSTVSLRETVLARYGAIPEVARFRILPLKPLKRETQVILRTHRGIELGTLLQDVDEGFDRISAEDQSETSCILREATVDDLQQYARSRSDCEAQFEAWTQRIAQWKLNLQLVELEWLFEPKKLVLYVLNERGPDCTKLALQAAAAGLGIIEVQPIDGEGIIRLDNTGGCGSGHCGCH